MNSLQYFLTKLAEEASEVAVDAIKAAQFGIDESYEGKSNRERLQQELFDLVIIVDKLREFGVDLSLTPSEEYVNAKKIKLQTYLNYAKRIHQVK